MEAKGGKSIICGRIAMDIELRTGCVMRNGIGCVIAVIDSKLYNGLSVDVHQWFYDVYTANRAHLWSTPLIVYIWNWFANEHHECVHL